MIFRKKVTKKISLVSLIISCALFMGMSFSYAKNPNNNKTASEISSDRLFFYEFVYPKFIDSLKNGTNFSDGAVAKFNKNHNKLFIGCSPVYYMDKYASDLLAGYGYDVIAVGGTTDYQIDSWFKCFDKQYERIVVWGAVNDIYDSIEKNYEIDFPNYFAIEENLIKDTKNHLDGSPNSKFAFVKVKPVDYNIDEDNWDRLVKYNTSAKKINDYFEERIKYCYDVVEPTDAAHSEWYLHYTNKESFANILNGIETLFNSK